MNAILAFLTSPLVGFLLKLSAALAAAGFGLFGVGTKSRDDDGRLTRHGRIALAGIILAGALSSGTSIYDFASNQRSERAARERSERLLTSVQRGIYPLRGIKASVELRLIGEFAEMGAYKRRFDEAIALDPSCKTSKEQFYCVGTGMYEIPRQSRLFPPAGSALRRVLDYLYVHVQFSAFDAHDTRIITRLVPCWRMRGHQGKGARADL